MQHRFGEQAAELVFGRRIRFGSDLAKDLLREILLQQRTRLLDECRLEVGQFAAPKLRRDRHRHPAQRRNREISDPIRIAASADGSRRARSTNASSNTNDERNLSGPLRSKASSLITWS